MSFLSTEKTEKTIGEVLYVYSLSFCHRGLAFISIMIIIFLFTVVIIVATFAIVLILFLTLSLFSSSSPSQIHLHHHHFYHHHHCHPLHYYHLSMYSPDTIFSSPFFLRPFTHSRPEFVWVRSPAKRHRISGSFDTDRWRTFKQSVKLYHYGFFLLLQKTRTNCFVLSFRRWTDE